MGAFVRWSDELEQLARSRRATDVRVRLRRWIRAERARLGGETSRAVAVAIREFPPVERLVTLSRSDAVRRVLLGLPDPRRPAVAVVLRSLPGGEGAEMARDLRRFGMRARVVADDRARDAVADADLVLLGADAVMADGSLVHKVGTRSLLAAARDLGVPVAVVTGTSKFCRRRSLPRPLPSLFDRSPGGSISVFWTDRGRITPRQVATGRPPWLRPSRGGSRAATAPARRRGA